MIVKAFESFKDYDFVMFRDHNGVEYPLAPEDCLMFGRKNVIIREADIIRGLLRVYPFMIFCLLEGSEVMLSQAIETEELNPEE